MANLFEEWKNKRLFRIEHARFKEKKYIHTSPIKVRSEGFKSEDLYPILFSDFFSKYYRMKGYNVMYPICFNNLNAETLSYARLRGEMFENLKENYKKELCDMAIGFDEEKEFSFQDKNFIKFSQTLFEKLYNDKFIKLEQMEVFVDFAGNKIIPPYNVYFKDGIPYYKNEELHTRKENVMYLDLTNLDILTEIEKTDAEYKKELYKILGVKQGLNIIFSSPLHDIGLEASMDNPQYIAGICFIALNPDLIDTSVYVAEEEKEAVFDFILNRSKNDVYTGLSLKNPLTGEDIYLFLSYKYDEDIHLGIPSLSILDHMFISSVGLDSKEIIEDGKIINSDFLNGLSDDEAHDAIIEAFLSEGMGKPYNYQTNFKILISSFDELGVILPVVRNYNEELLVLDNKFYPIYYTNRYKISINNEDLLDPNYNILKMVFSDSFINAISNIYAYEFDNNSELEYFNDESQYIGFDKDSLAIFKKEDIKEEVLFNIVLNKILIKYNKKYNNYKNIISLDNLEIDYDRLQEEERLGVSYVDVVVKKSNIDAYRLYLFCQDIYDETLSFTLENLKRYENIIDKIKEAYVIGFKDEAYPHSYFLELKKNLNKLIENYDLKKYTRNLIEFFNAYVYNHSINKKEAFEFLIMLSLVTPNICENINKEVFKENYSIFVNEWV